VRSLNVVDTTNSSISHFLQDQIPVDYKLQPYVPNMLYILGFTTNPLHSRKLFIRILYTNSMYLLTPSW